MKVGIVGSRSAGDLDIDTIRRNIPENCSMIISGGAVGVDTMAEKLAVELGIDFVKILPDYDFFGKQAPLVRNTEIVKKSQTVIAFWDYQSRGTAHAIRECIRLDVPIKIISIKSLETSQQN